LSHGGSHSFIREIETLLSIFWTKLKKSPKTFNFVFPMESFPFLG